MPAYPLPADRQETVVQRVLIRHGIGYDKIMLLADDLRDAVHRLSGGDRRASQQPGFHH